MTVQPLEGVACGYAVTYRLTTGGQQLSVSNFAVRVPSEASIGCINNSTVFGCVDTDNLEDGLCVGSEGPTGNLHDTCEDTYSTAYAGDDFRRFEIMDQGAFCYNSTTSIYEVTVELFGVEIVCGGTWAGQASSGVCGNCSAPFDFVSAANVSECDLQSRCPCPLASSSPVPATGGSALSDAAIGGIAAGAALSLSLSLNNNN